MLNHYPKLLRFLLRRFRKKYPEVIAKEDRVWGTITNTFFMIEKIPTMDNQGRIDRWIGWVSCEACREGVANLGEILKYTRQDLVS